MLMIPGTPRSKAAHTVNIFVAIRGRPPADRRLTDQSPTRPLTAEAINDPAAPLLKSAGISTIAAAVSITIGKYIRPPLFHVAAVSCSLSDAQKISPSISFIDLIR